VVHDFSIIENDPEVQIVVEAMGGIPFPYECTKRALKAGKSVVTSNKELVATHGYELLKLAKENGCSYLFEASVGGGIPILRPMTSCLAANELQEIVGILNGTTNYILTRMIRAGLSFEAALKEAQDNGYAERDPSADIEGKDACRKICILSSLGYGRHIYPNQVPTQGITEITLSDVAYARSGGYKIKLLGRSIRRDSDGKVCAYVAPHLVADDSPLANVEDVFNAIQVTGDSIGDVMFYGRGAGKLPTASAVVADVMDIVRMKGKKVISWEEGGEDTVYSVDEIASQWYVRVAGDFAVENTKRLRNGDANDGENAFITNEALTLPQLHELTKDMDVKASYRVL
jgi:homoserine dehydrogenase